MKSIIGYSYEELLKLMEERFGRGAYHAKLLFENIYKKGLLSSGKLDESLQESYHADLPPVSSKVEEGGTIKFLLKLEDGFESETIILPMEHYNTLCVSSQIGCRWSCSFCETGKMGMKRNLSAGEIVTQLMTAQLAFKKEIRNIVFMGMGEPFDNFDNVLKAIDIFSHHWAMNLNKKNICISTVGNVEGINRFSELGSTKRNDYHKLHLAVSLNGADDVVRSKLMPVNQKWPMSKLKKALEQTAQYGKKYLLYFEYVLIKDLTDGIENGYKLVEFVQEFPHITLNLIPYNPGSEDRYKKPEQEELDRFHRQLINSGIRTFTRYSQGEQIMAACGQLGNKIK